MSSLNNEQTVRPPTPESKYQLDDHSCQKPRKKLLYMVVVLTLLTWTRNDRVLAFMEWNCG